jgi:hypothetical protein
MLNLDPDEAMSYLDFVVERHRVWEQRQAGVPGPWTDDPILATRKFTNVYRVLDYGSQFLVRELLTPDLSPRDTLARCFLYRYTNLPATWDHLKQCFGDYPCEKDLYRSYIREAIQAHRDYGFKVFSGAYVILPQPNRTGDKVQQAVDLAARWMSAHADDFLSAENQADRFEILRREYGVGPFLAMQILTDWGYSVHADDREDEFVVPGPGCIKGAKAIAPDEKPMTTLHWAIDAVRALPDCPDLDGRPPSWMDIQNTLCEFSKYHRYAHSSSPAGANPYTPEHPGPQAPPAIPIHWLSV